MKNAVIETGKQPTQALNSDPVSSREPPHEDPYPHHLPPIGFKAKCSPLPGESMLSDLTISLSRL